MDTVRMKFDMKDVDRLVRAAHPAYVAGARDGINRAMTRINSLTIRGTAGELGIQQKLIRARCKVFRARANRLSGYIRVLTLDLDWRHAKPKAHEHGVTVQGRSYPGAVETPEKWQGSWHGTGSGNTSIWQKSHGKGGLVKIKLPIEEAVKRNLRVATAAFTGEMFNREVWKRIEHHLNRGL